MTRERSSRLGGFGRRLRTSGAAVSTLRPVFFRDWSELPLAAKLIWYGVLAVAVVLVVMVVVAAIR